MNCECYREDIKFVESGVAEWRRIRGNRFGDLYRLVCLECGRTIREEVDVHE